MATSEEKRWAKEARLRRQALKKAAVPPPNLFQARIRRTELSQRPRSHVWVRLIVILIAAVVAGVWWNEHTSLRDKTPAAVLTAPKPDLSATLQASSAPVVTPVAVSLAPVVNPASTTSPPHAAVPDSREWHAATSGVHEARQVIIKSSRRWRALWAEMQRTDDAPRIDFFDHWVVGVFLGPKDGAGYEVQIQAPEETDADYVIKYRVVEPLPGTPLSTEKTYPWQLRVFPRSDKTPRFSAVAANDSQTSH